MFHRLTKALFFGNYFYGICAVGLCIEASLQQHYPLNNPAWYVLVFCGAVLYYTYAYIGESHHQNANQRTLWYIHNHKKIIYSQVLLTVITAVAAVFILYRYGKNTLQYTGWQWGVIIVFPVVALMYYGVPFEGFEKYNLRRTGWMKPFLIGFVWAGCITVYPLLFNQLETGHQYVPTITSLLLFVKNFMFISVLGIMFDIKDYASDYNKQLKTFVVRVGLRKTLFYIIIPLTILGFISFMAFALLSHFPLIRTALNSIPFIALVAVAYSMYRRKSIMFYLAVIDGLMLLKAFCGILAMLLIN